MVNASVLGYLLLGLFTDVVKVDVTCVGYPLASAIYKYTILVLVDLWLSWKPVCIRHLSLWLRQHPYILNFDVVYTDPKLFCNETKHTGNYINLDIILETY